MSYELTDEQADKLVEDYLAKLNEYYKQNPQKIENSHSEIKYYFRRIDPKIKTDIYYYQICVNETKPSAGYGSLLITSYYNTIIFPVDATKIRVARLSNSPVGINAMSVIDFKKEFYTQMLNLFGPAYKKQVLSVLREEKIEKLSKEQSLITKLKEQIADARKDASEFVSKIVEVETFIKSVEESL